MTQVASGHASSPVDAAQQALRELKGATPSFVLVFASPSQDLQACLRAARAAAPTAKVMGCATAGEITERGLTHGQVAVVMVAMDRAIVSSAITSGMKADPVAAGAALCASFAADSQQARSKGFAYANTLTLMDGLAGTGETLIGEIVRQTQPIQQVTGGAAGDEGAFKATPVGEGDRVGTDLAAAIHVFSGKPWGIGLGHGLRAATRRMTVTRAKGNVVQQLDGRPAFDVYKEHAMSRGTSLTPETAGSFMIGNEIGIVVGNEIVRARAPLSVGADGSLSCAAAVPQGASVFILDGDPDSMLAAARRAATDALAGLHGNPPAGVLLFDCVCRGMILADQFAREIAEVRSVLGDVPVGGFLTYGEIANYGGTLDGWHNTTAVVVAIPS